MIVSFAANLTFIRIYEKVLILHFSYNSQNVFMLVKFRFNTVSRTVLHIFKPNFCCYVCGNEL